MVSVLLLVFSGHASAIFDEFLFKVHDLYVKKKESGFDNSFVPNVYTIETQWDCGGNTEYILEFNNWLEQQSEFVEIFGGSFILPPPMGDLKPQVARWSKHLIKDDFGKTISSLLGNRHENIDNAFLEVKNLVDILHRLSPDIFLVEDRIKFLDRYFKLYREFDSQSGKQIKHSVGNLFIYFMYYCSFLLVDSVETIYDHHHQAFFNFLKDLSLIPRGNRIEFLIDGRYNLRGVSKDNVVIPSEKFFDDYVAKEPVKLDSYTIDVVSGSEIENKFQYLYEQSDIIIIPPGSLSNWMPLINKFHIYLSQKPLLWFVNAFTHYSETTLNEQIEYFQSLGLDPIIVAPKLNNAFDELNEDERSTFEKGYKEEGKSATIFDEVFTAHPEVKVIRAIPLKELEPGDGGLKYNPKFVEHFLLKLTKNLEGKNINKDTVFENAKIAASKFTERKI